MPFATKLNKLGKDDTKSLSSKVFRKTSKECHIKSLPKGANENSEKSITSAKGFSHTPNNDITFGWLIWYKSFASFAKILTTPSDNNGCNFFSTTVFPANFPLNTTAEVLLPVKYKRKKELKWARVHLFVKNIQFRLFKS